MSPVDRLQTLESAAALLQLQPSTLRRWVRQGRIRSHELRLPENVGGRVLRARYLIPRKILADLAVIRQAA